MSKTVGPLSAKITNMSLWCAMLVVAIHCEFDKAEGGISWLLHQVFTDGCGYSRIAVPFFFLISGFFLAGHVNEKGWYPRETWKRVLSIALPFFMWALIYQLLFAPLSVCADYRAGRPFGYSIPLINGRVMEVFGLRLDMAPYTVPLWYLRTLFLFVVASPIVAYCIKRCPVVWLVGLLTLACVTSSADGVLARCLANSFDITCFFYFAFGMFLRIRSVDFASRRLAIVSLFIGLAGIFGRIVLSYHIMATPPVGFLVIACLMYATWYFMPATTLPHFLAGIAFPVYLMHPIFICGWNILAANIGLRQTAEIPFAWPVAFVLSVLAANIVRKYMPRAFCVLFGGR